MQIEGKHGPGWPKMTWKTLTERDSCEVDPCDRDVRRSRVRSAMCAAKLATWKEGLRSPLMWMLLLHLQVIDVNRNTDDDNDDEIGLMG